MTDDLRGPFRPILARSARGDLIPDCQAHSVRKIFAKILKRR